MTLRMVSAEVDVLSAANWVLAAYPLCTCQLLPIKGQLLERKAIQAFCLPKKIHFQHLLHELLVSHDYQCCHHYIVILARLSLNKIGTSTLSALLH